MSKQGLPKLLKHSNGWVYTFRMVYFRNFFRLTLVRWMGLLLAPSIFPFRQDWNNWSTCVAHTPWPWQSKTIWHLFLKIREITYTCVFPNNKLYFTFSAGSLDILLSATWIARKFCEGIQGEFLFKENTFCQIMMIFKIRDVIPNKIADFDFADLFPPKHLWLFNWK